MILVLPVLEHGIALPILCSPADFSHSYSDFNFRDLPRLWFKVFINIYFLVAIVNGISCFIFLSPRSLLVYKSAIVYCIVILSYHFNDSLSNRFLVEYVEFLTYKIVSCKYESFYFSLSSFGNFSFFSLITLANTSNYASKNSESRHPAFL